MSSPENLAESAPEAAGKGPLLREPLLVFKRSKADEPNGRGKFGLIKRRAQAADRVGFPNRRGQPQHPLSQRLDSRDARATAAEKNPATKIIQQALRFEFVENQLKNLFQSQMHDPLKVLQID